MRIRLSSFAALLILTVAFCGTALAGTVYQIKAGGSGTNVYPDLQSFKEDVVDMGYLVSGDVIEIYNDDNSLTAPIPLDAQFKVTVRSMGGKHTISSGFRIVGAGVPDLSIENVVISNASGIGVDFRPNTNDGTLTIKNSVIENSGGSGLALIGGTTTTLTNTSFINNENSNAFSINNTSGITTEVNVNITSAAPLYTYWKSNETDRVITINTNVNYGGDEVNLNFDVAGGRRLVVDGTIWGTQVTTTDKYAYPNINFEKTGTGTLRLNGGIWYDQNTDYQDPDKDDDNIDDNGSFNMHIAEGTMHFDKSFRWNSFDRNNPDPDLTYDDRFYSNGSLHVGKKGTIKPSIEAGDLEERIKDGYDTFHADNTYFELEQFTSEKGARLEVGGISSMPFVGTNKIGNLTTAFKLFYHIASISDPVHSNTAKSLSVNNRLMEAYLELCNWDSHETVLDDPTQYDSIQLRIERIENLAILDGVGGYADIYRRMEDLSEYERDMLDGIYNRGGTGSDLGFLQTIGGHIVQNAMLAMHHNQANLIKKINSRLTSYHKEELEYEPQVTGSEVCYYSNENPFVRYGEMWASIDQQWMTQGDVDTLAGYHYNSSSVSIGYDHHWDNMIVGGVLNYTHGNMKMKNNRATKADVDSVIAAVYASWALDGWYMSGTAFTGYGWNSSESSYSLPPIDVLKSKTGNYATSSLGVNFETGYMMETDLVGVPLRVTPYGSLGYARIHRGSARETGADDGTSKFNRQFRSGNWNTWDAALGVRVSVPMDGDGYTLIPSIDLAWTRTMGNAKANGGDVHFIRDPSTTWGLPLMASNRSSYRAVAGLDARFANNVTVGGSYELEYRHKFWKNQFSLNASMDF